MKETKQQSDIMLYVYRKKFNRLTRSTKYLLVLNKPT